MLRSHGCKGSSCEFRGRELYLILLESGCCVTLSANEAEDEALCSGTSLVDLNRSPLSLLSNIAVGCTVDSPEPAGGSQNASIGKKGLSLEVFV